MIKKISMGLVCVVLCMLCLVGCNPDSLSDVKARLGKELTLGFTYVKTEKSKNSDGYDINIYHFKDENDVAFTYTSGYSSGYINGLGDVAQMSNSCNYARVLFLRDRDNVEQALQGADVAFEEDDLRYEISVSKYGELDAAADGIQRAIAAMDPLPIKRKAYGSRLPVITVTYNGKDEMFPRFDFLCNGEDVPDKEAILEELQQKYADEVRRGRIDEDLDNDTLDKSPASILNTVKINGQEIEEKGYDVFFSRQKDYYYMLHLDPCQDFDGYPLSYVKGNFKFLVEKLGGSYTCDNWQATWTFGSDTWEAKLTTQTLDGKEYSYKDMTIKKNGAPIALSPFFTNHGSTPSGRQFSLEDLEKMLPIRYEIDQKTQTLNIYTMEKF